VLSAPFGQGPAGRREGIKCSLALADARMGGMGRGQKDAFSAVMGKYRGRSGGGPLNAAPTSAFYESLDVPDRSSGANKKPVTCSEFLITLSDFDEETPLYVIRHESNDSLEEAECVLGVHHVGSVIWRGDEEKCVYIGVGHGAPTTLGEFKELLRGREPGTMVRFRSSPDETKTFSAYRVFSNRQGQSFLAFVTR